MAVIYTYECPDCGKTTRDFQIIVARHDKCEKTKPGKKPPYWKLKEIDPQ